MPSKRKRPLTTQEAGRMERAHRRKELVPSIRESPHIEAQSLLSLMEKGKLQSDEGSSGYWAKLFFFFFIIFLFVFFFFSLLYNSLWWNKMFQSRQFISTSSPQWSILVNKHLKLFKDTPWEVYLFHRRRGQDGRYNAKRIHDTNTTPHGQQHNPHQPSDKTRLASTPAKNGKEGIHRASRPRHNLR
jgi:hypothetical protein